MTVKEKVVGFLVKTMLRWSNRNFDIKEMQKAHNAFQAKVIRITVTDVGKVYQFRIRNGMAEEVPEDQPADCGLDITSDAFIALALGQRTMMNPDTGETFKAPYSAMDALNHGELRYWGPGASNDALLFARLALKDVMPSLQKELRETPLLDEEDDDAADAEADSGTEGRGAA